MLVVGIAEDIDAECRGIANTLEALGPDAPAGVGAWSVADLAGHLHSQFMARGAVVFAGRLLVAGGVHLGDRAGGAAQRTIALYRRRGFESGLQALRAGLPKLLLHPRVAPVALFEVWVHHDDVRRANRLSPPAEPETLDAAVDFALRYQRRALAGATVDRSGSAGDLLRWLGGRPSPLPPHEPPLRF